MQPSFRSHFSRCQRRTVRHGALTLVLAWTTFFTQAAQVVLYQERFETEGEGTRWTSEGRGVSEDPASGPAFWGLNFGPEAPSFVGVRANAPARRAAMVWRHDLPADAVTEDFLRLFDCVVGWMTSNRTTRTVLFSPPPAGTGDEVLVNRLITNGFTVLPDNTAEPVPDPSTIALVIQSSSAVPDPTRFTIYTAPLLSFNASNHDDELVSSIGVTSVIDLGTVRMNTATNHPARCGLTNSFIAVTNSQNFDLIGPTLPSGAVTIADYDLIATRTATTLADVDAMITNAFQSIQTTGTVQVADLSIGEGGRYTGQPQYDQPVPGSPDTAATFGVRGTGKIEVAAAGTWTFALGVDDGARLRIDRNRNGFDAADNVFNEEDGAGFRVLSNDVVFAQAGTYDFEWVTLDTGANFAQEIAVSAFRGGGTPVEPWDPFSFELLGEASGGAQIRLMGEITIVTYVPNAQLRDTRPLIIVVDGGASLLGGPLTGFEGNGFFGGADLNDPDFGSPFVTDANPRSLTLPTINVAGQSNVQVKVFVAGSDVDFEDPDFFRIIADIDADGPAEPFYLAHFRQFPTGHPNRGALGDTNDNQRTVLRGLFKEVTYNIPANATDLRLRFEGHSTFFNEVMAFDNVRVLADREDVKISIQRVASDVVVTYTGVLQSSATVNGPFTDVANARSPFVVPPASQDAQRFYRACRQ